MKSGIIYNSAVISQSSDLKCFLTDVIIDHDFDTVDESEAIGLEARKDSRGQNTLTYVPELKTMPHGCVGSIQILAENPFLDILDVVKNIALANGPSIWDAH